MARDERGRFTDWYDYGPPRPPSGMGSVVCFALAAFMGFGGGGVTMLFAMLFLALGVSMLPPRKGAK